MEDAHLAEVAVNSDPHTAVFAVFDGHGGAEVAKFCQKYLAAELSSMKEFEEGSMEESLIKVGRTRSLHGPGHLARRVIGCALGLPARDVGLP